MKKILIYLFCSIFTLFLIFYTLLFSSFGNNLIANYVENKVKKDCNISIDITKFSLSPFSLNMNAKIEDYLDLNVSGKINLFSLYFNLDYIINHDVIKIGKKNIKNTIFKGKIEGKIWDLNVNGDGFLFGSKTNLKSRLYDYFPIDLKLKSDGFYLDYIAPLLHLSKLIDAKITVDTNISSKDLKAYGDVFVKIHTDNINNKFLFEKYGFSFPENFRPITKINARIEDKIINFTTSISSFYFDFKSIKSIYDIQNNSLKSDFYLKIIELANLKSMIKSSLKGKLDIYGEIALNKGKLEYFASNVNGVGGDINAIFKNNKFILFLKNVKLENVLDLSGNKEFAHGLIDANVSSNDLNFKALKANINLINATINSKLLKEEYGLIYPEIKFNLSSKIHSDDGKIIFKNDLNNDLFDIKYFDGFYDLNHKEIFVKLKAKSKDFSKIKEFANLNNISFDFDFKKINNTIKNLKFNFLVDDGKLNIKLSQSNMQLKSANLDIEKILTLIGKKEYANGILDADINLDNIHLNDLSGEYDIKTKGQISKNFINNFISKKLPNDLIYDLNSKGEIINNIISFDLKLFSNLVNIEEFNGKFDVNNIRLKSNYEIDLFDFSKFGFLIDKKLQGNAKFNGKLSFDKTINAQIQSNNLFNGKFDANLKDDNISVKLNNFDFSTFLKTFDITDMYGARANMEFDYNILENKGIATLDMFNGKFKKSPIINAISLLMVKDLTQDTFNNANARANINKENIDFNLNMKSKYSDIEIQNGKINTNTSSLNIPFNAKIDKIYFKGSIKGTAQDPKVKIDAKSIVKTITNILTPKNDKKEKEGKIDKFLKKIF